MASPRKITRRTVLRGVGASVALPWLECIVPCADAGEAISPPLRLAYFYVPNGVHMPEWRPTADGPLDSSPTILSSLDPVKDTITVISNLAADHCDGNGAAHEPAGGGFLVGKKCKNSKEPEVGGRSVDQVVARQIGVATPVDSLDPAHHIRLLANHYSGVVYLPFVLNYIRQHVVSFDPNRRQIAPAPSSSGQ